MKVEAEEAPFDLLDGKRHSRLTRAQNVVAFVMHFVKAILAKVSTELRDRVEANIPEVQTMESFLYINASERENAMSIFFHNHWNVCFSSTKLHALKQLKLKQDGQKLLRCQRRLGNSNLLINTRQPVLLATRTDLVRLVVEGAPSPLHCGINHIMARVRERFWIPKLRQMARTVIKHCVSCQKLNNIPYRYPGQPSRTTSQPRQVLFGLICSPVLLSGTINYQLENHAQNNHIGREIENNTYKDNVVLTSKSTDDAVMLYKESKAIFEEMQMNLREFLSNDGHLRGQIADKDFRENPNQKTLGILWNSTDDTLLLASRSQMRWSEPVFRPPSLLDGRQKDPLHFWTVGKKTPFTFARLTPFN
ncbi:hypothetical protein RB195_022785 [Necator americanus]|uniref:Integrase zinc-binding domain-containing protein n=1 Tax=Necator americanus TaxID=51031 RepID=A0ABR1EGK0_NECAM